MLGALFASASVLIPFAFGAALGGIASGRVEVGNAVGDPWSSWLNPTSALIGVIAVLTGAYLAAVYLAGDSVRAELPDLARAFRQRALLAGRGERRRGDRRAARPALRRAAALRRADLRRRASRWCSSPRVAGVATLALVWTERYGPARATAALAVVAIVVGWALAQDPYVLPPSLTLDEAAAADATLQATIIVVAHRHG